MGTFVTIIIKENCKDGCKKCVEVCPVNIFELKEERVSVVPENEDECTFCNLCLEACPENAILIKKEY